MQPHGGGWSHPAKADGRLPWQQYGRSRSRERSAHMISGVYVSSVLEQPLGGVLSTHEGQQVK